MPHTTDVLERFHEVLLQEIRESRPEYLTESFTVAEIYQELVPYRSHRDRIGVDINGDYEDALLRMLSGEGGYLRLDSEVALREIREELEGPNPNSALFREFAAAEVRLNPQRASAVVEAAEPPAASEDGVIGHIEADDVALGNAGGRTESQTGPTACFWCRQDLPNRDSTNFCPFCGGDLRSLACHKCGEELEWGWQFCVSCGTEVRG
jgi:hypothetical protein